MDFVMEIHALFFYSRIRIQDDTGKRDKTRSDGQFYGPYGEVVSSDL